MLRNIILVSGSNLLWFVHVEGKNGNKNISQRSLSSFITIAFHLLCRNTLSTLETENEGKGGSVLTLYWIISVVTCQGSNYKNINFNFHNDFSIPTLTNISCWHGLTAGSDGFFSFYNEEMIITLKSIKYC